MTDPDRLLVDYEATIDAAQERAERIRDGLTAVQVTERTDDGQISVTVNASGNLVDLRLTDGPRDKPGPELAQDIMRALRQAQSRLADVVHAALGDTAGPETLRELETQYRTTYPVPPEEPGDRRRRTLRIGAEEDLPTEERRAHRRAPGPGDPEDDAPYRNLLR